MTDSRSQLDCLLDRIRAGSDEAVRELLEQYGPHLLRIVRRRLGPKLRPRFDSADFMQSVWASFFTGDFDRRHFDRAEDLLGYLVRMAQNKITDAYRPVARDDARAPERSLEDSTVFAEAEKTSREPTPSQFALAEDQWQRLLAGHRDEHRRMLVMLRLGYTHAEIAEAAGVDERTVRRLVRRALSQLGS